jgi:hypothetical protein
MQPVLFDYATKELSQDAFLCWLLKWSEVGNKSINPSLYNAAKKFVREIIEKDITLQDIEKSECIRKINTIHHVDIKQQNKGIDLYAVIDDCIIIVIEDKTQSGVHNKGGKAGKTQLDVYREEINNRRASSAVFLTS